MLALELTLLGAELSTSIPPILVNSGTDVTPTVDVTGVMIFELLSDWAVDVIHSGGGCWSNAGFATDVVLAVMTSADVAVGDTIGEPTCRWSAAGSLSSDKSVSGAPGTLSGKRIGIGIASTSDVIIVDDASDAMICLLTEFMQDDDCVSDVSPRDNVAGVLTVESTAN